MTTKLEQTLEVYGLNKNEIKVFLTLVELRGSFAKDLIEKTKLHKNIIYDNIYKLIDKGLVSEILVENKKYFICENPQVVEDYIQSIQKKFKTYNEEIEKLKTQIKEKHKEPSKTNTKMFTGIEGVKQLLRHEIEIGKDYMVIGAPKESVDMLGEVFWKNFVTRQKSKNMRAKLIFNESLRDFAPKVHSSINEIRFLKDKFEPITEIVIYDKFVSTIVWSKEPVGTLIENEEVARSYKKYFDVLWKQTNK